MMSSPIRLREEYELRRSGNRLLSFLVAGVVSAFFFILTCLSSFMMLFVTFHSATLTFFVTGAILFMPLLISGTVALWSYRALMARKAPPIVQILWLRRFETESQNVFRLSRVIDRLSRHGIASITLQDTHFRLSSEQLLSRYALRFVLLSVFSAIVAGCLAAYHAAWLMEHGLPSSLEWAADGLDLVAWVVGKISIGVFFALAISVPVVYFVSYLGEFFRARSDNPRLLKKHLLEIASGKLRIGARIIRVGSQDDSWKTIVGQLIVMVDIVVVDVSHVTAAIDWEILEVKKLRGSKALIAIASEGANPKAELFRPIRYPDSPKKKWAARRAYTSTLVAAIFDRISTLENPPDLNETEQS